MKKFFKIFMSFSVVFVFLIVLVPVFLVSKYFFDLNSLGSFDTTLSVKNQLCKVSSDEQEFYSLDLEQTANAALIAAISVQRNLPSQAASIAIATAAQESGLRNINHGDLDSLGLFQQRPSQGWGSPEQIMDPNYSTNKFYDALEKIFSYETKNINDVAQEVQRSNHPDAYRKHESLAKTFAAAFTGYSGPEINCVLSPKKDLISTKDLLNSLTLEANNVAEEIKKYFYSTKVFAGEDTQTVVASVDNLATGWSIANWAVGVSSVYHIEAVYYQNYVWVRNIDAKWEQLNTEMFHADVTIKVANGV